MDRTTRVDKSNPYLDPGYQDFPVINVLSGILKGKKYLLTKKEYLIGRDPKSDIVIDDRKVSQKHAMISKSSGGFLLCDLDSTNGIFVNNRRMGRYDKLPLKAGDTFQIGTCIFQFVWQSE